VDSYRPRPAAALLVIAMTGVAIFIGGTTSSQPMVRTHVDAPPPGFDVRVKPSLAELEGKVRLDVYPQKRAIDVRTAAADGPPPAVAAAPTPAGDPGQPGLSQHVAPSCSGTGGDGNRVQVIYAFEQGKPDRYNDLLPLLRSWVADVDDTFALSSRKTGGGLRVRWVHANCVPDIKREVLPAGALYGDDINVMIEALDARGYNRPTRKYLVFADATRLCGIGQMYPDSDKNSNLNDGAYPMFARVDSGCWSFPQNWHSTAAHELMHTVGGVQYDAPHSTPAGHCRDENDAMCYDDDGSGPVTTQEACGGGGSESLFDCRNDDYFNTAPARGSYLDTHWNPANSSFLDSVVQLPAPPKVTISGPSRVRPGLAARLTAASNTRVSYRWSATPSQCLPGSKTGSSVTVMCPSYYTGSVRVSVTGTTSAGIGGTAARTLALTTGPKASMTGRLAGSGYAGGSTRLTGKLRYGKAAVRGHVYLYAAPASGGSYKKVAGPVDTGTDGAHSWTIAPKKNTRYAMVVSFNRSAGWGTPPQASIMVKAR